MAELLKGAPVARALTEELAARCAVLREQGIVPTLAIVRVGERVKNYDLKTLHSSEINQ